MCIASIILAYIRKRNSYFHPYIDCMIFAQNTIHKMLQNIQFFYFNACPPLNNSFGLPITIFSMQIAL